VILDYDTDPYFAHLHDIFDAETGEDLRPLRIHYADDQAGIIRRHLTRENNRCYIDPLTGKPATVEEERRIKIVPRVRNSCDGA
jgi:hypothetical protein